MIITGRFLHIAVISLVLIATVAVRAIEPDAETGSGWWPAQRVAKGFVTATPSGDFSEQVLLQGLAGLAAQAVNERRDDEIVWLVNGGCFEQWKDRTLARIKLENRGSFDVWKLLDRYINRGLVKGYILYAKDSSAGQAYGEPRVCDLSLNCATTLAGLLDGVPVEVAMEERVQALGLKKIGDGRDWTPQKLLEAKTAELSRGQILALDPKAPNMRDFAIAHRAFVDSMSNDVSPISLKFADPLSPVVGWFCGDEFSHVAAASQAAHLMTVSNWAADVPFLSMGSSSYQPHKIHALDPHKIDFDDQRSTVSFMMSDGDNLGWMLNGFQQVEPTGPPNPYWDSPEHGKFPMGWCAALGDLVDVAPVAIDRLAETQPSQTTLVQMGGGYFYPDHFASALPERDDLLRKHARRIAAQMARTGAITLTFICDQSDSPEAQHAMRIFAEEIHPLLGMLVVDYVPYNRMEGKTYWIPDGQGGEVPAITDRYLIWEGIQAHLAGGPDQVADDIAKDAGSAARDSWISVHAWSQFTSVAGPQKLRGIEAVSQCVKALHGTSVRVVSPEEMLWRLRYRHDASETQMMIAMWESHG